MAHFLEPHGLQHTRLSCPSLFPRVFSNSCPLSRWWHPTISSSVAHFSCLQSFPASGSFLMSRFFPSGGQSMELQLQHQSFQWVFRVDFLRIDWFDFVIQGTLKSLLQYHNAILWHSAFFMLQLNFIHDYWKYHSFD